MDFPRCLEQSFLTACEINDIERAGACLTLEADPNIKTEDGECLCGLIYAAEKNYPELCDLLLAHPQIDVNIRDGDDCTPLMLSCCEGHSEITGKLARKPGVDFNCQGIDGSTAATWAAAKNKTECLQILATQESVDWNIQNDYGYTAAIKAVARNHVECVRILLTIPQVNWNLKTNDKDPNFPNSSALTLALEDGNKEMINLVLTANGLQLDIDHLKSKDVFSEAVTACRDFEMGEDRVNDEEMVTRRMEEREREECECPVCFNVFTSRMKIFQCTQGHFTCETCRKEMQRCPECREDFMGRAIGFERYLRKYDS